MKRLIIWLISLIIAASIIGVYQYVESLPDDQKVIELPKLKDSLEIGCNIASESKVKSIFEKLNLNSKYNFKFSEDPSGMDVIATNNLSKISNKSDIIFNSYTPLIFAMKNSSQLQKYKEGGLLISSRDIDNSTSDEIFIDFSKVIDLVLNPKEGETSVKVIIPKDGKENTLFRQFLLVTINGGSYPETDDVLKTCKKTLDKFLDSSYVTKSKDIINDLKQVSSINNNEIYVLFEADLMNSSIWSQNKLDLSLVYPKETVVKKVYFSAPEDKQTEILPFAEALSESLHYRTSKVHYLRSEENAYNITDNFSFVEVPETSDSDSVETLIMGIIVIFLIILLMIALLA